VKFAYRRSATDEQVVEVDIVPVPERAGVYRITVGERVFELAERLLHRAAFCKEAGEITLQFEGREYRLFEASQRRRPAPTRAGDLRAPMAGKIIRVLVQPGEQVKAGATLLILEAMKMEHQMVARDVGVVKQVRVEVGQMVDPDEVLIVVDPVEADAS